MGKNFSKNNTGKRKKADFYETPYSMTQQLLDVAHFPKKELILEPAAGNGAIVEVLLRNNHQVIYYDLLKNFLTETEEISYIITNPPYSLAYEFILKAKEICLRKFAYLLPLTYLHGQQRYEEIWTDEKFPLESIHVFTRYPLLGEPLRKDGRYHTGMQVYAWFIWDKLAKGSPLIKWINNDKYVLRKSDEI